jgi:hypothetical protein
MRVHTTKPGRSHNGTLPVFRPSATGPSACRADPSVDYHQIANGIEAERGIEQAHRGKHEALGWERAAEEAGADSRRR